MTTAIALIFIVPMLSVLILMYLTLRKVAARNSSYDEDSDIETLNPPGPRFL